jgi:hypothetical protein
MIYNGNFKNWVNDAWVEEIISKAGQARPRDWAAAFTKETEEYKKAVEAGYDLNSIYWWVYEKSDVSFDIIPPWVNGKYHWWITKLTPGQFMPMHTDPHTHENKCIRHWVPLQDYCPGHIFIYKDEMISNYKKGDVFSYYDSHDIHGAANISHMPRVVLQVTEYVVY